MKKKVIIINYGSGNLFSIRMALEKVGAEAIITKDEKEILKASHVILPGVGAFSDAMQNIKSKNFDELIKLVVKKGNYLLGICLGMQLLLS